MKESLIFVYNANSGKANAILDVYHKIASPGTYKCNLCKLTHGIFKERTRWKNFRQNLKIELDFLHANEFRKQYASASMRKFKLPVVLKKGNEGLDVFISCDELNKMDRLEQLISLIEKRLD